MNQRRFAAAELAAALLILLAACGEGEQQRTSTTGEGSDASVETNRAFSAVEFIDSDRGWAVAVPVVQGTSTAAPSQVGIVATADGGQTWSVQKLVPPPPMKTEAGKVLTSLDFVDPMHGWAAGEGLLLTTTDGTSWSELVRSANFQVTSLSFVNPEVGWVTVDGQGLQKTADGGLTWTHSDTPCDANARSMFASFLSPHIGWLMCTFSGGAGFQGKTLYRTEDGGGQWTVLANAMGQSDFTAGTLGTPGYFSSMFFLDEQTAWLVLGPTPAARLRWSDDGGLTWQGGVFHLPLSRDSTFLWASDLHFIDRQHGWMVASVTSEPPGEIFTTADGGQSWVALP